MNNPRPEILEATVVTPRPSEPAAGRHGVSLASLFVITTAVAVLMSGFAPVGQLLVAGEIGIGPLATALGGGLIGGMVLGLLLGMHRYNRGIGALLGGSVGAGLGLLVGPLALLPGRLLPPVGTAMFIGSLLMVAVAIVMRPAQR